MARGNIAKKNCCEKCKKTIRKNQTYRKCKHCAKYYHAKCLFHNMRGVPRINEDWICTNCTHTTSRTDINNDNPNEPLNDENELRNEIVNMNVQTLNNMFSINSNPEIGGRAGDNDNEINIEELICDKYITCDEFDDLYGDFPADNTFTSLCLNIRSISNACNLAKLKALLNSLNNKPDLLGICETWLLPGQTGPYMSVDNYIFIENSRPTKDSQFQSWGGVGMYIKSTLKYDKRDDLTIMTEVLESIAVDVYLDGKPVTILNIYRPPKKKEKENKELFICQLNDLLLKIKKTNKESYVMGDLNQDLLDLENESINDFKDLMFSFSYRSLINKPTRICSRYMSQTNTTTTSATCLTHIWTTTYDKDLSSAIITNAISDHLPVAQVTFLKNKPEFLDEKQPIRRVLNGRENRKFVANLESADLDKVVNEPDLNTAFTEFSRIINNCLPNSTKKASQKDKKKKKSKPWYDGELHLLKCKKERAHKKYIMTRSDSDKDKYNKLKKTYIKSLCHKENNFYKNIFHENQKNSRVMWTQINKLMGRKIKPKSCQSLLIGKKIISEPAEVANTFNLHFSTVATKLHKTLPSIETTPTPSFNYSSPRNSFYLSPTDPTECKQIIKKLKPKNSTSLDPITTKMIKSFPLKIICVLSFLINRSLSEGTFPELYKRSKVIPVFKKGGKKNNIEDYRPINLLPSISKIIEKVVHKRLYSFMEKHKLINPNQFGFRKKHSTNDAINYAINKIASNLDQKEYTLGIFCDLSKAFDCLHTPTLLNKLRKHGIRGTALEWFRSYMTNRSQVVEINGNFSTTQTLKHGAAQGSILGPLLFIIYINDLAQHLYHGTPIFFADDTTILISNPNFKTLIKHGNEELNRLTNWLISNKLILNKKKTKAVIFRTRGKKIPLITDKLKIKEKEVKIVKTTTFLGLELNEHLNWKEHMLELQKDVRKKLAIVSKIRMKLNRSTLINIFTSLVLGKIRYCITSWCYGNLTIRNSLQRSCNNFIRMIFGLKWIQSVKPIMKEYNIPSINAILIKELANIMHKYYSNTLPVSLSSLFLRSEHTMRTRSGNEICRSKFKSTLSQQAISYRAAKVWDLIPNDIKYLDDGNSVIKNVRPLNQLNNLLSKYLAENPTAIDTV